MIRRYELQDGKIRSTALEVNAAEHCNLSCRSCSHLSPLLPRRFVEPATLRHDLSRLARAYSPDAVRLVGGEPLLHPQLLELIAAVRASGITGHVALTTNGTLLWRMPETFWQAIDSFAVSVYPGRAMTAEQVSHCSRLAQRHGVNLSFTYVERFREQFATRGSGDAALVRRIYETCELAHLWRCHTVADGFFYKCSPAQFLPRVLGTVPGEAARDGLHIEDGPAFRDALLAYLQASEPLDSCRTCLGSSGRLIPHQQVDRRDWLALQDRSVEELLDLEYLEACERSTLPAGDRGGRRVLSAGISRAV